MPPVATDIVLRIYKRANVRDRAILITLFTSGIRSNELIMLDVSDFLGMSDGTIIVRHGKGGKVRAVPIPVKTRRAIRQWLRERPNGKSDALFTTYKKLGTIGGPAAGERLTYWGLREITRRAARSVGLEDIGRHSFRHAFVIAMIRAGVPESMIGQMMGWSPAHTSKMIRTYATFTTDDLQSAVDRAGLDRGF